MRQIKPFNPGDRLTREYLNGLAMAIRELQNLAVTKVEFPLRRAGGTLMSQIPITSGEAGKGFWARITDNVEADSPAQNRWLYAWEEVGKLDSGYDGWDDSSGGRSGSLSDDVAYNSIEDMNTNTGGSAGGPEGNGVDVDNLGGDSGDDYSFTIQPCPAGVVIWMYEIEMDDSAGTIEYWFCYENGVDGECT